MRLEVWMEGFATPLGVLERYDDGNISFSYAPDAGMDISVSMSRGASYGDFETRAFFSNLLFEGPQLIRARERLGLDLNDVAGLLYHLGGDCSGALSITPEGRGPGKFPGVFPDDYEILSPERLARIAVSLSRTGAIPNGECSPSPLAGYQGKIALLKVDGKFYLPHAGTGAPTTHILKMSSASEPMITNREAALLALAGRAGLEVVAAETMTFDEGERGINAVLIERFDRQWRRNMVHRLHCEDLCQSMGLPSGLKYGYNGVPGRCFTSRRIGEVLARLPAPDLAAQSMIDQTLFNLLVGNTDNHAKNTTISWGLSGSPEIAPLYDVVPIFMDSSVTHKLAFRIGEADFVDDIHVSGILDMMKDMGMAQPTLSGLRERMACFVDVVQVWAEQEGGEVLADALSAQMRAVETTCGIDLGVIARGAYQRLPRDYHDISF